jgi:hypothetical protein
MNTDHYPLRRLRSLLATLGGAAPMTRRFFALRSSPWLLAAWWLILFLAAFAFSGRTTRFIYVDF